MFKNLLWMSASGCKGNHDARMIGFVVKQLRGKMTLRSESIQSEFILHKPAIKASIVTALQIAGLGLLFLTAVAILSAVSDKPIAYYTRDIASISDTGPMAGVVSQVGMLLWAATVTTLFLAAYSQQRRRKWSNHVWFVGGFGLFTFILMIDDLFMVHENIFPRLTGLPEMVLYGLYGLLLGVLLLRFRSTILQNQPLNLLIAFGFLGLSLLIDRLPEDWSPWHFLFEDGAKFLGIAFWCSYFVQVGYATLRDKR